MRTAHEIFLTVGAPITVTLDGFPYTYQNRREFREHDIGAIQKEAYDAGVAYAREVEARNALMDKGVEP